MISKGEPTNVIDLIGRGVLYLFVLMGLWIGLAIAAFTIPEFFSGIAQATNEPELFIYGSRTISLFFSTTVITLLAVSIIHICFDTIPTGMRILLLIPFFMGTAAACMAFYLWFTPTFNPLAKGDDLIGALLSQRLTDANGVFWTIVIIDLWFWVPLLLAASYYLKEKVRSSSFEVLAVEGFGRIGRFRHGTLPVLLPLMAAFVFIKIVEWCRSSEIADAILDNGGPGQSGTTLPAYLNREYYNNNDGFAFTITLVLAVVLILILRFLSNMAWASYFMPWKSEND